MKQFLGFLLLFTTLVACTENTEKYLYKEGDADYENVAAMYSEVCESETEILTSLKETDSFDSFVTGDLSSRTFKFTRTFTEENNTKDMITYVLIERDASNPTANLKVYVSSNYAHEDTTEPQNFYFEYTATNNSDMRSTISTGVCSTDNVLGSTTFASSWLRFNPSRTSYLDDDNYTTRTETVTVRAGYPIFLSRFEQAETFDSKDTGTQTKWSYATGAISEVTDSCSSDTTCSNVKANAQAGSSCTISIDTGFNNSGAPSDKLSEFSCP